MHARDSRDGDVGEGCYAEGRYVGARGPTRAGSKIRRLGLVVERRSVRALSLRRFSLAPKLNRLQHDDLWVLRGNLNRSRNGPVSSGLDHHGIRRAPWHGRLRPEPAAAIRLRVLHRLRPREHSGPRSG